MIDYYGDDDRRKPVEQITISLSEDGGDWVVTAFIRKDVKGSYGMMKLLEKATTLHSDFTSASSFISAQYKGVAKCK